MDLSDKQTAQQLDEHIYDDEALVEIAIPLNMPYVSNQDSYERYDGSIELNGMHYNYVKRKINNDTLHILCIPNDQKTQLHEAKNDYTKQLADASSGKKENDSQGKKNTFFAEYNCEITQYSFGAVSTSSTQNIPAAQNFIPAEFIGNLIKPPQIIA